MSAENTAPTAVTEPRSLAARLDHWLYGPAFILTMRRFRHGASPATLAMVALGSMLVTGLLAWAPYRDPPLLLRSEAVFWGLFVQGAMMALLAIGLGSVGITVDRARETLQMLTLTPMTAAEFVRGRVFATAIVVLLVGLPAGLPLLVPALTATPPNRGYLFWEVVGAEVCFFAQAFVFAAAGTYFSSTARRPGWAVVAAFTVTGMALLFILEPIRFDTLPLSAPPPVLGALQPYWAAARGGELAPLFAVHVPIALVAWLGGALCVGVLLAAGAEGMRELRRGSPFWLRTGLLALTFVTTVLTGSDLGLMIGSGPSHDDTHMTLLGMGLLLMPLIATVFATAGRADVGAAFRRNGLTGLFSPRSGLETRGATGGFVYCLLWALTIWVGALLARGLAGRVPGYVLATALRELLVLLGWAAMLAALGFVCSAACRERFAAGTVVVTAGVLTLIVPFAVVQSLNVASAPDRSLPLVLFGMLSPLSGFAESFPADSNVAIHITGMQGGWVLTPLLHFGLAVVLLAAAWWVARRGTIVARN